MRPSQRRLKDLGLLAEAAPLYAYRLTSSAVTIPTRGLPRSVKVGLALFPSFPARWPDVGLLEDRQLKDAVTRRWTWPPSTPLEPEPVGAVVLGTPQFAPLLADPRFCIQLINAFFKALPPPPPLAPTEGWNGPVVLPSHLTILRAVVDGLVAPRTTARVQSVHTPDTWSPPVTDDDRVFAAAAPTGGLAIAIGRLDELLPDLAVPGRPGFEQASGRSAGGVVARSSSAVAGNAARAAAALEFLIDGDPPATALGSQPCSQGPARITVPLANTLFKTGRPVSVWAAHWRVDRVRKPFPADGGYVEPDVKWRPTAETIAVRLANHQWQGPSVAAADDEQQPGEPQQAGLKSDRSSKETDKGRRKSTALGMAVHVRLKPITRPRRIVAGLGNVMRRIRGPDGEPAPASRELEAAVHRELADEARQEWIAAAAAADEPLVIVWALLVPGPVMRYAVEQWGLEDPDEEPTAEAAKTRGVDWSGDGDAQRLDRRGEEGANTSKEQFVITSSMIPKLLAMGCQLRRILSGGGGWGPKQGLLALDPDVCWRAETAAASAGEPGDGMEGFGSFLASLKAGNEDGSPDAAADSDQGQGQGGSSSSNVTPGSYVQFLVERSRFAPAEAVEDAERKAHAWSFMPGLRLVVGSMPRLRLPRRASSQPRIESERRVETAEEEEERLRLLKLDVPRARAFTNWFGVASSAGFYVEAPSPSPSLSSSGTLETGMGPDSTGKGTRPGQCMGTKIDVPGARITVARGHWEDGNEHTLETKGKRGS